MAENDIYNSKARYENLKKNIKDFLKKPDPNSRRKYYCKNPINIK